MRVRSRTRHLLAAAALSAVGAFGLAGCVPATPPTPAHTAAYTQEQLTEILAKLQHRAAELRTHGVEAKAEFYPGDEQVVFTFGLPPGTEKDAWDAADVAGDEIEATYGDAVVVLHPGVLYGQ